MPRHICYHVLKVNISVKKAGWKNWIYCNVFFAADSPVCVTRLGTCWSSYKATGPDSVNYLICSFATSLRCG